MNNPRRRFLSTLIVTATLAALPVSIMSAAYAAPPVEVAPPPAEVAPSATAVQMLDPNSPTFAADALRVVDDMYRGRSSHGLMEMEVKTKHWTRTMAMETWSLGTEHSLVRLIAPKKEKGTATLKSNDDLFTYLSKTGRTIKITGGMMGGNWMGSHFTNDDLVHGVRLSEDFEVRRNPAAESPDTYVFELVPKPNTAVVWGKIDVEVRRVDFLPVSQRFYDEEGTPMRRMTYSDFKELAGKVRPTLIRMEPLDKPGEYTQMRHRRLEVDVDIDASFFTLQKLRSL